MNQFAGGKARQGSSGPSICMPTRRGFIRQTFHAAQYEAEDVLAAANAADLIEIQSGRGFALRGRAQRSLLHRGVYPALTNMNPGLQKVRLERNYDVFIAAGVNIWDVLYYNAIEGWRDRCGVSICWLSEIWRSEIAQHPSLYHILRRFDHVFISMDGSVDALSECIGKQCHVVSPATDTLRFTPYPAMHDRSIDVYGIGRRWEGVHNALRSAASDQKLFYIHDTSRNLAEAQLYDYAQHRQLLADIAKRSKYFLVSPGKMNLPNETSGQIELGYRYFEGSAAGAVLIEQAADTEVFRELFPWADAVVEINSDGSDALEKISELNATPGRLAEISRRNAVDALLRHDWIHRWMEIFQIAGIEPSPGMTARVAHLQEVAQAALQSSGKSPN